MKNGGFGQLLRQLRQRNGISVSMISQGTGISRSSIYRWENGESVPKSLSTLDIIANFLGISPSFFIQHGYGNTHEIVLEVQPSKKEADFHEDFGVNKNSVPKIISSIDDPLSELASSDYAEQEAYEWITKVLVDSIRYAEAKMKEANTAKDVGIWDSRRTMAVRVLKSVEALINKG